MSILEFLAPRRPAHPTMRNPSRKRIERGEWWLWFSAVIVLFLSAVAFFLFSFPPLFNQANPLLRVRLDQAAPGLMGLVLVFLAFSVYRQWQWRRLRKRPPEGVTDTADDQWQTEEFSEPTGFDSLTGLHHRHSAEERLGKEMASARRLNKPLTVLALDLDGFKQLNSDYGTSVGDAVLQEFAKRLKKATRGSDFAVRLGGDEFLLVLPECNLVDVKRVMDRLSPLEVNCAGQRIPISCSGGWLDCQPGELPAELLKRADEMLRLYKNAGTEATDPALATG